MKIDLIVSALPPTIDGIGDYTARLAAELAKSSRVRVLTSNRCAADAIDGVEIVPSFAHDVRRSVWNVVNDVAAARPDWVVLQFNQFSFGRWGLNPFLPLAVRAIRRRCPAARIAVTYHEDFVPKTSWKYRVMRLWQKPQFVSLGRAADVVFFSIEPWAERYRDWFGAGKPVMHLPVGSNIADAGLPRDEARARLGIANDAVALSLFGSVHPARNLPWVQAAVAAVPNATLIYIGADVDLVRGAIGDARLIADGPLPADEVSRRIRAADISLAPFSDGLSTRRTSMMTGLQHGIATVGTHAEATGDSLHRENGRSLILAPAADVPAFAAAVASLAADPARRHKIGTLGAAFYVREFDWPAIGRRLVRALNEVSRVGVVPEVRTDVRAEAGPQSVGQEVAL